MPDVTSSGEDRNRRTTPEQARETRVNPANPVSPMDPVHKDTTPGTAATEPTTGRDTLPGTGAGGMPTAGAGAASTGSRQGEGTGVDPRTDDTRTEAGTDTRADTRADTRSVPPAGKHAGSNGSRGPQDSPLLPNDECDQLASRMQHAVAGFVDRPRDAVEEADHVLEELAARFTDAVNTRRRTLRGSWQAAEGRAEGKKGDTATTADTEQLRLALRDYRELTERLLHV